MRGRISTEPSAKPASGWAPVTAAVVEALLLGTKASVKEVVAATGLSTGSVTNGLHLLAAEGLLTADAGRGRNSGGRVADRDALLSDYTDALGAFPPLADLRTGVLWSDPVADAVAIGRYWESHGRSSAATGALAAAVLAPFRTEVSPIVIYVDAKSASDLHVAASAVALREIEGGRLSCARFRHRVRRDAHHSAPRATRTTRRVLGRGPSGLTCRADAARRWPLLQRATASYA